ncbi:MAG: glycosyltransferase [Patescibacteria group bacterium]
MRNHKPIRVAIVHDYLNQAGGAERVLDVFISLFPQADIYTLFYDREKFGDRYHDRVRGTSFINYPIIARNHRLFIPFMPHAAESIDLGNQYDVVISATSGYAKGIRHNPNTYHLSYCYTPLRYAWELDSYFSNPIFKSVFRPAFAYLRNWDFAAGQKPDKIITISRFIADKIERYYGREAKIVYPPLADEKFFFDPSIPVSKYYLAVGRFMHYKKFDLLVRTFRSLPYTLKIVGSGPEDNALRSLAGKAKNIQFLGNITDNELRHVYAGAKAFIFPQAEDFGLVAAEAQACGTPIIAYREGGALEIVDRESGVFFDRQDPASVSHAVLRMERAGFDRKAISAKSARFSTARFTSSFMKILPKRFGGGA